MKIGLKRIVSMCLVLMLIVGMLIPIGAASKPSLTDIKGHWAESYIHNLYDKGYVSGSNGRYEPDKTVSRAEFTTMLLAALGKTMDWHVQYSFSDIKNHWGKDWIELAVEEGILVPSDWGINFQPDKSILRDEMAFMVTKALDLAESYDSSEFEDTTDSRIIRLYDLGILSGSTQNGKTYFKPKSNLTRAESAVIITKILDFQADSNKFLTNEKNKIVSKVKLSIPPGHYDTPQELIIDIPGKVKVWYNSDQRRDISESKSTWGAPKKIEGVYKLQYYIVYGEGDLKSEVFNARYTVGNFVYGDETPKQDWYKVMVFDDIEYYGHTVKNVTSVYSKAYVNTATGVKYSTGAILTDSELISRVKYCAAVSCNSSSGITASFVNNSIKGLLDNMYGRGEYVSEIQPYPSVGLYESMFYITVFCDADKNPIGYSVIVTVN